MKRIIIYLSVLALTCCMVWAWSGNALIIRQYVPPPRSLSEAYAIALQTSGANTNQDYCYEAKISHERFEGGAWVFKFQPNTDSPLRRFVYVAMRSPAIETQIYFGDSLVTNFVSSR